MGAFFSFRVTTKNVFPTGKLHTFHRCLDTKVYPDSRLCLLHAVRLFRMLGKFLADVLIRFLPFLCFKLTAVQPGRDRKPLRAFRYLRSYVYLFILQHCSLFINRTYIEEIMCELSTLIFTFKIQLLPVYFIILE